MADRKKLSGAQYRKRKAAKEKETKQQEGSFVKYLHQLINNGLSENTVLTECSVPQLAQSEEHILDIAEEEAASILPSQEYSNDESSTGGNSKIQEPKEHDATVYNEVSMSQWAQGEESGLNITEQEPDYIPLNYGDPATWNNLPHKDSVRQILVKHGTPEQVQEFNFPKDGSQRKFSKIHYNRRLANGEVIHRQWLQYSISKDAVFCFCCKLFSIAISGSSLSDKGSKDWKNISGILSGHERSREHLENVLKWKELETRLRNEKTIDEENVRLIKREEQYWQQILERLIALVRVLGVQNLAFRGTKEKLNTFGNGNFLKFVEFLALFDPLMREHLRKVKDKETHVHYLGKDIQNELIQLLSNSIQDEIVKSVRDVKYFSIILDCTPDIGHVEQMTIIIRFVDIAADTSKPIRIREHFMGFVPLTGTTGAFMTSTIVKKLENINLPIMDLRGQGYDNGSNMKGKENGVQRRILDINPRALFVPCSAHSLNLVVNDAAKCCLEATAFLDVVQRVYVFFSASTRRWEVLMRHVPSLTVKPLSDTRWESRINALKPLRYQLGDIYDALIEISEDNTQKGESGNLSRIDAEGLAKGISNFKFVVSLVIWYDILFEVNLCSKLLQEREFDIYNATKQVEATKNFLVARRSDIEFQKTLVDAREVAEELGIPFQFEPNPVRIRRKKKQFAYEADDEPITCPEKKFKIAFYFAVLDTAIQSVDERFQQMKEISSVFGFLYDIHLLQNSTSTQILEHSMKLEKALEHGDSKDIDGSDLCSELKIIARRIPKYSSPHDVLNFICEHKMTDNLPNVFIALRILLTLPVSVASAERSFSKLKLIKTYIRSSMSQDRLVGLANLSIEHEIADKINPKTLVSTFATLKARKVMI